MKKLEGGGGAPLRIIIIIRSSIYKIGSKWDIYWKHTHLLGWLSVKEKF